jgi:CIC family chloride channel protein
MARTFPGYRRYNLGQMTSAQVVRALWLGAAIGLVAGVGAIAFAEAIEFATRHLLEALAGFDPPDPLGEGSAEYSGPDRAWALPLVLGAGGFLSGLLVFTFAPEAEGHGTDAAIDAFHRKAGRTRWQVVPVKLLASAITIGSGGAAGREGPTAQIGGGFGSFLATRLNLDAAERRKALAAGMGAGIGAIFRAPLGGAMMAAEVLYTHDFEADVILLSLIASIVSYSVFCSWYSFDPIFGNTAGFTFSHISEIPYYALLGVACGLMGLLYVHGFYGVERLFKRLPAPRIVRPMLGGLLAGTVGIFMPESIHVGYGWVQRAFDPGELLQLSPWLLVLLPFARILTTSLTVGSGGSGGIFGPGMVIGGMLGAAAWRFMHGLPGFPADPAPVIIICMIAMFGAVAHSPLAMLLMVGEMTGNLSLLAPAMAAVAVATLLVGDTTIYKSQVATRAESPAHRHRFAFPLLSAVPVHRAARAGLVIDGELPPAVALANLGKSQRQPVVVLAGDDLLEVTAPDLRRAVEHGLTLRQVSHPIPASIPADSTLDHALDLLTNHERRWLPVVDGRTVVGVVDAGDLLRSYRRAVDSQIRPLSPIGPEVAALDVVLTRSSGLVRGALREVLLPEGVRVLIYERDGASHVPDGTTQLRPGDRITIAVPARQRAAAFALILGED